VLNRIYTIGHSTRTLAELVGLLREHHVRRLADIRRFPGSQRHPHFSRESLEGSLPEHRIDYVHFEDLGGRRAPSKQSPNTALTSESFRGYADHMATNAFADAIARLLDTDRRTAVMCAESKPSNCHRNLLSDELMRRHIEVVHILAPGKWEQHRISDLARFEDDRVLYPAAQSTMFT
jgi:uncharacterized protein (DUF488 family)